MDRLPGHAEGVADLLPRSTLFPRQLYVHLFDTFGEAVQSEGGAQTGSRIIGPEGSEELLGGRAIVNLN